MSAWIFLVFFALRRGLIGILDPLFTFGLASLIYFRDIPEMSSESLFIGHLLCLITFIFGVYISRFITLKFSPSEYYLDNFSLISIFSIFTLFSVSIIIILFINGMPFFNIMTAFYSNSKDEFLGDSNFTTIVFSLSKVLIPGVIYFRILSLINSSIFVTYLCAELFFFIGLFIAFSTGIRSYILFVILSDFFASIYGHIFLKQKINYLKYFVVIFLGIFVITFLTINRSKSFIDINDLMDSFQNVSLSTLFEDKSAIGINVNEVIDFGFSKYGLTNETLIGVFAIIVNPVPRAIWPDKPVGYGKIVAHDMFGTDLFGPGLSLAGGIVGESYYNLGWLGIGVFSAIFGFAFKIISRCIKFRRDLIGIVFVIYASVFSYGFIRGDWLSALGLLYPLIIIYIITLIFRKRNGSIRMFSM